MTKLDHTFRTIGKFLSIASASKVLKEFYGEEIPKERMFTIIKELEDISNDYLYPKYILKDSSLIDINDYENINNNYRTESDNMLPKKEYCNKNELDNVRFWDEDRDR